MNFQIQKMSQKQAEEIAYQWHYDGDYSFYDMEADQEDLEEFVNPDTRDNHFACMYSNELIGFFSFHPDGDCVDIGLGMRPDLTGKGQGLSFLQAVIEFIQENYQANKITLAVATFNQRAIKVYEKVGFIKVKTFMQNTNGSTYEFAKMELDLK